MRRGKPTAEASLTRAIRGLLNSLGIWHYKNHGGLGSVPGLPDLTGIHNGRAFWCEIKAPKGVVSEHQQRFIDAINAAGGLAFVAKDIETVIEKLGLQDRFLQFRVNK